MQEPPRLETSPGRKTGQRHLHRGSTNRHGHYRTTKQLADRRTARVGTGGTSQAKAGAARKDPEHASLRWTACKRLYCTMHQDTAANEERYQSPDVESEGETGPWEIRGGIWAWRYHEREHIRTIPARITDLAYYPTAPEQVWTERTLEEGEALRTAYPHATPQRRDVFEKIIFPLN